MSIGKLIDSIATQSNTRAKEIFGKEMAMRIHSKIEAKKPEVAKGMMKDEV